MRTQIEQRIDGTAVKYLGSSGQHQKADVLGAAQVLLHLISFDEPFGLSLIEAMACGTPVIAFARGSIPEIVRHGETGYIVEDIQDAVSAVATIQSIDRFACREDVEQRFSHKRMARDYVDTYEKILNLGAGNDRQAISEAV